MNEEMAEQGSSSMALDFFQIHAEKTAMYPGAKVPGSTMSGLTYTALGLAGEAGGFAGKVKKVMRDDAFVLTAERKEQLIGELGDTLWYAALCAKELGVTLSEVADANLKKLAERAGRDAIRGDGDNR